ncbi:MAG: fibronectin type III domain-containing protein [Verrucomicrobiia bacterium]
MKKHLQCWSVCGLFLWLTAFYSSAHAAPKAPTNLAATAVSTNQINLSWTDNSNNETGFKVERALDNGGIPGPWTQIATVGANITSYSDTGVSADTRYWYRVRAYKNGGDSAYSNQASATTPPPPPSSLTATAISTNQINLSWTDNSNTESSFKIERAPDSSGAPGVWTQIATVSSNVTAYSDTPLSPNTKYWYRVRASSGSGDSAYSSQTSATTLPLPPAAPSSLTASTVSSNQISLSWTDNSGNEDGFKIERAPDIGGVPGAWTQIATVGSNVTAYSDLTASADTKYWYRVRAYNTGGDSTYSNQANATTPPLAPSALTATAVSTNQINLSWADNSNNEDGFKIERAPDNGGVPGAWAEITTVGANVTNHSDTELLPNTTYWYRVRAYNGGGNSDCSNEVSATTPLAPPSGLTATTVSSSQINLSWADNSGDEDGFKIERSTDGTNFTQIAQVLANTTSYRNTGLFPDTTHYYRVQAYNSVTSSDYSGVTVTNTSALCPPAIVVWEGYATPPIGLTGVVAVSGGGYHSLALSSSGNVAGWGANDYGQATPPPGLTNVVAIAAGGLYSLALKSDGSVVGWGWNYYGQATPPAGLTNAVAIAAGFWDSLALRSDGTVVGWGAYGDVTPPGLSGIVAIAKGYDIHGLGLRSDGTVVGWGNNYYGQATPPAGLTGVVAVAAGDEYSLALKGDGTVVGWGRNDQGQATPPNGLTNVVAISTSGSYNLALTGEGTVVSWGTSITPPDGLMGVVSIAAGEYHGLAMTCSPAAPTALTAIAVSTNQINLSWTDNSSDETGFLTERAPDNGGVPGTWTQIATVGADVTTYSDTNVSADTKYWYRVRAYNTGGNSPYGNQASATTLPLPPAPPSSLTATAVSINQINLGWTDNAANEDGFKIERAPDNSGTPGTWTQIATVSSNVTIYSDTGLSATTTYWYRVRAYNSGGNSDYSNQASATTLDINGDADGDGLPNGWETAYGLNPLSAAGNDGASGDPDGDGFSNFEEYQAGTQPNNAASHPPDQSRWTNTGSDKWEGSDNWAFGRVPSTSRSAVLITNATTKTVTIDASTSGSFPSTMTISNLALSSPTGSTNTLLLSNAGTNTPLTIINQCTISTNGLLIITNSTVQVNGGTYTSNLTVANGAVRIDGGVLAIANAQMLVGTLADPRGKITVNGGELRCNGASVRGSLDVMTGGTLISPAFRYLNIGNTNPSAPAIVTVNGGNFDAPVFFGNYNTFGQIVVSNGIVTTDFGYYGVGYLGGKGTLTVAGGTMTLGSELRIARESATGTVWVTGGQLTVTNGDVIIGQSRGTLVVSNGNMLARGVALQASYQSSPTLLVAGGKLTVQNDLAMGQFNSGSTSTVWITGGQLLVTNGTITVGLPETGFLTQSNGTVLARSLHVSDITASAGGRFTQVGGTNTVSSDFVIGNCSGGGAGVVTLAGGKLYVTNAAHTATLDVRGGTFTVSGGALVVDRLVVTNACSRFIHTGGTVFFLSVNYVSSFDADADGLPNGWELANGLDMFDPTGANGSNGDPDGDGLPNVWEMNYGLNPKSSSGNDGASGDPDGDGLTNLQEFQAGTDPTNSASGLRITGIVQEGDDVEITWMTAGGRTNAVQAAGSDADGSFTTNFSDISGLIIIPDSGDATTNYLDIGAATTAPSRFYRIRLVP